MNRILASLLLVLGVSKVHAAFIQNNFGLSDPHSTITFSEYVYPDGSALTTEYADLGITFSPVAFYFSTPNTIIPPTIPNFDSQLVTNFQPFGVQYPFSIVFSQQQSEAAFAVTTVDGGVGIFQAFLGGVPVESGTASTGVSIADNFYGFRDITFDAISVSISNVHPVFALDNLQLQAIPEPPGFCLLLAAIPLVALFSLRHLRSKYQNYVNTALGVTLTSNRSVPPLLRYSNFKTKE